MEAILNMTNEGESDAKTYNKNIDTLELKKIFKIEMTQKLEKYFKNLSNLYGINFCTTKKLFCMALFLTSMYHFLTTFSSDGTNYTYMKPTP